LLVLLLLQLLYVAAIAVDATVAAVVAAVQLMLPGGVTATIVIATLVVTVSNVATITSRITHDDRDGGDCYCYFIDSCLSHTLILLIIFYLHHYIESIFKLFHGCDETDISLLQYLSIYACEIYVSLECHIGALRPLRSPTHFCWLT
jgi:hypothetical protein